METLDITGLSCAGCAGRAERALGDVDGVAEVSVNFATKRATLAYDREVDPKALTQALKDAGYPAQSETITLQITGMTCGSCVGRVEHALLAVRGVQKASANLATSSVQISFLTGMVAPDDLQQALASAGYESTDPMEDLVGSQEHGSQNAEVKNLKARVWLAGLLTLPVFLIEMGGHLFPPVHHWVATNIGQENSQLIQMGLTAAVLLGPGRVFFAKGLPALFRGAPDMNALVAIGTLAGFGYSALATLVPQIFPDGAAHVYFESAAVIVFLVLLGRLLEAQARGRAGSAISGLIGLGPKTAIRIEAGEPGEVAVSQLREGDVLRVRPGERIAADGQVIRGSSYVDESMISGEPLPVTKGVGNPLIAGTVNGAGSLDMRVTHVGADTVLSGIVRMVEDAQGAKLPIQAMVDRITLRFVPAVMCIAVITVIAWILFGPTPSISHALVAGVSVLIIACPCAMGLATPTSIMVGTGRAAELGILFRRGDALQRLDNVDMVVFDKTGTLTEGKPRVVDVALATNAVQHEVLRLAAAVEAHSEHPIARAIVDAAAGGLDEASHIEVLTGLGVTGHVADRRVILGNRRLMELEKLETSALEGMADSFASQGATPVWVACDGQVVGVLSVADSLKPGAVAAVSELKAAGIAVAMVTGDTAATARAIADQAGIDELRADCLPGDKVSALEELHQQFGSLAFVGDGINDAPALAFADVGLAIGGGTDIAMEAADVVLMSEDPRHVSNAIHISRRTMRNIRENLIWAFGYNVLLIPVAAGVLFPFGGPLLSPAFAAAAMALSSVLVVSNALRLRRISSDAQSGGTVTKELQTATVK